MKILQKCYKDRKSYICTFDWKRVSCERTLHTMSSKYEYGYSFHYKYMYNRINQDILVSDLE